MFQMFDYFDAFHRITPGFLLDHVKYCSTLLKSSLDFVGAIRMGNVKFQTSSQMCVWTSRLLPGAGEVADPRSQQQSRHGCSRQSSTSDGFLQLGKLFTIERQRIFWHVACVPAARWLPPLPPSPPPRLITTELRRSRRGHHMASATLVGAVHPCFCVTNTAKKHTPTNK